MLSCMVMYQDKLSLDCRPAVIVVKQAGSEPLRQKQIPPSSKLDVELDVELGMAESKMVNIKKYKIKKMRADFSILTALEKREQISIHKLRLRHSAESSVNCNFFSNLGLPWTLRLEPKKPEDCILDSPRWMTRRDEPSTKSVENESRSRPSASKVPSIHNVSSMK